MLSELNNIINIRFMLVKNYPDNISNSVFDSSYSFL